MLELLARTVKSVFMLLRNCNSILPTLAADHQQTFNPVTAQDTRIWQDGPVCASTDGWFDDFKALLGPLGFKQIVLHLLLNVPLLLDKTCRASGRVLLVSVFSGPWGRCDSFVMAGAGFWRRGSAGRKLLVSEARVQKVGVGVCCGPGVFTIVSGIGGGTEWNQLNVNAHSVILRLGRVDWCGDCLVGMNVLDWGQTCGC